MDILKFIKEFDKLSGEQQKAALDAFNKILVAKGGVSGPGMPPPETLPYDPDLEEPDTEGRHDSDDDTEIDDPEDLLKKGSEKSDEDDEDDFDDDDFDDDDSDEDDLTSTKDSRKKDDSKKDKKDKKSKKDDDGEKEPEDDSDDTAGGDGEDESTDKKGKDDTDKKSKDKDSKTSDGEDEIDDTDFGPEIPETADEVEKRIDNKRNNVANKHRLKKLLKQAMDIAQTEEEKKALEDAAKELDELETDPKKIDQDEFDKKVEEILNIIDGITDVKYETDNEGRLDSIKKDAADTIANDDFENEDNANISADPVYKKMLAREAEKKRYKDEVAKASAATVGSMEAFKKDLVSAVSEQIDEWQEQEEPDYSLVDRHHEDDDIASPGMRIDEIPDDDPPSIDVYFDQSGSWGTGEVKQGMQAIKDILALEEQDLLKINIYYFSEILSQNQAEARSLPGEECWDLIIDNINAEPKAKNVIIMTDSDIKHDYGYAGHRGCINGKGTTVDGCVWFIWKNNKKAPEAAVKLKGKQGTFQYTFAG